MEDQANERLLCLCSATDGSPSTLLYSRALSGCLYNPPKGCESSESDAEKVSGPLNVKGVDLIDSCVATGDKAPRVPKRAKAIL